MSDLPAAPKLGFRLLDKGNKLLRLAFARSALEALNSKSRKNLQEWRKPQPAAVGQLWLKCKEEKDRKQSELVTRYKNARMQHMLSLNRGRLDIPFRLRCCVESTETHPEHSAWAKPWVTP